MRNTDINLKLSNVLNNLPEFFNRVDNELNMSHGVQENYNMLNEYYYDVCSNTIDGLFYIEEQKDFCIEFIEFCMDEFRYFKNIFDYTQEEILNFCPGLTMENYGSIYNKLIELYELDKDIDTVGVGGYNVDFDSVVEEVEEVAKTPVSLLEEYVKHNSYFDSECEIDEDGDETILFTTRKNGLITAEIFSMSDYWAGGALKKNLEMFYGNEFSFSLETVDEWIHIWGKRK